MSMKTPTPEKSFDLYVVDGKTYDLTEWIPKHPGGSLWFARCQGRDISAVVHAYHSNPHRLKGILLKYQSNVPVADALDPSLNVPRFILPEKFDARTDGLTFDWNNPDSFLNKVK